MSLINSTINNFEPNNDIKLSNIETNTKLYNSKFEYLGDIGRFRMLDENQNTEWINIHNKNSNKSQWIKGDITHSYKRGYVIKNIIYKKIK